MEPTSFKPIDEYTRVETYDIEDIISALIKYKEQGVYEISFLISGNDNENISLKEIYPNVISFTN